MRVAGFVGASGSGKTTLVEAVVRELKAQGLRISAVKHARHGFAMDTPGKDSARFTAAGAFEVVVASGQRLAKLREFEAEVELNVHQLLAELVECDWALYEGFKHANVLKFEVWRAELNQPVLYPEDPYVVAIVTDDAARLPEPTGLPVFALNDAAGVVRHLLAHAERFDYDPELYGF